MDEEELDRPYRVIIHNDDVTTFEFVINILVVVFEQTFARATHIAYETHNTGASYVCTLPLEEAAVNTQKTISLNTRGRNEQINVKVPAGVATGKRLRISGTAPPYGHVFI